MVKIIKGKYKRIPKKFSKHLSDMVHWLLTKNRNKRPSIEDIILHPFFQKKAVQLRIPLPLRPKEVILPGHGLKVTGGAFDNEDFKMTSDSKRENAKLKIRRSDITRKYSNVKSKVNNLPPKGRPEVNIPKSTYAASPEGPFKLSEEKKEVKVARKASMKNLSESKEKEPKGSSLRTNPFRSIKSTINEVFLSGQVQKEKQEMRKKALQKRKQYGKMIQKQVLKMYKKKINDKESTQKQRFSEGVKKPAKTPEGLFKKKKDIIDDKELVNPVKHPKRSFSVYAQPKNTEISRPNNPKNPNKFDPKSKKFKQKLEIISPKNAVKTKNNSRKANVVSSFYSKKIKIFQKQKEESKTDKKPALPKRKRRGTYT